MTKLQTPRTTAFTTKALKKGLHYLRYYLLSEKQPRVLVNSSLLKKHHLYTVEPKPRYKQGKPSLHNISEYLTRCCVVVQSNILGFHIWKICRYPQMRQSTNLAKAVLRQCHDPRYLAASPKPSPCTLLFITSWGRKRILSGGVFIVHGGHIGRGLIFSDFGTMVPV